jgi:hypothetical protein
MRFLYGDPSAISIAHSYEIFIWGSSGYQYCSLIWDFYMRIPQLSIRWDFYMRISQLSILLTHMRFLYGDPSAINIAHSYEILYGDSPAINIAHSYGIFIWGSFSYQYYRWASNSVSIQSSMSIKSMSIHHRWTSNRWHQKTNHSSSLYNTVACKRLVVFPFWRSRTFFWPHFDLINHQKVIFCYCSSSRWMISIQII